MKRRLHDFDAESSSRSATRKWVAEVLESRAVEFLIVFFVMVDAGLVLIEAGVQDHLLCVGGRVAVCPPAAVAGGAALAQSWRPQAGAALAGLAPDAAGLAAGHDAGGGLGSWRRTGLRAAALAAQDWRLGQPHSSGPPPPHSPGHPSDHGGSPLSHSSEHSGHGGLCPHPGEPVLVCDTRDGHEAHHLTHVCHLLSVSILCGFLVELSLKWWSNPDEFASNFYHKLDFFVTVVSLLMDTVVYAAIENYKGHDLRGEKAGLTLFVLSALLILARTWRVVRICHGIFEEFHIVVDEEVARLEDARRSSGAGPGEGGCRVGGPTGAAPAD